MDIVADDSRALKYFLQVRPQAVDACRQQRFYGAGDKVGRQWLDQAPLTGALIQRSAFD